VEDDQRNEANNAAIESFSEINKKLIHYDFLISPYYSGIELVLLKQYIEKLPIDVELSRKEIISEAVSNGLYNLNMDFPFRARLITEGYMKASWFGDISHMVEIGLIEFYRLNFVTCVAVWFPLVEGILRKLLQIPVGKPFRKKESLQRIMKLVPKLKKNEYFIKVLTSQLVDFLENVYFKEIDAESDLPSHNFNRHFIGHNLSAKPYYFSINCLRLLSILDLILAINFLVDSEFNAFFENDGEEVTKRITYYGEVFQDATSEMNLRRIAILCDHKNFKKDLSFGK